MVNVSTLLTSVSAPTGMWPSILNWIESSVVNYGWVIILFTLLVKACLSPLDLLIKFTTKKTTLVQQKLAPQIARLNKKYANDKQTLQMQTNTLYKKEGFSVFGSCIVTLINLVVTMVVFFTLFASLRTMSAYKAITQYDQMQTAYLNTISTTAKNNFNTTLAENGYSLDDHANIKVILYGNEASEDPVEKNGYLFYFFSANQTSDEKLDQMAATLKTEIVYDDISVFTVLENSTTAATSAAEEEVNKVWNNVKDNWLWIDNIWVTDDYKSPLPTYDNLKGMANSSKVSEYKTYVENTNQTLYNNITNAVHAKNQRWNGYFILAILAAVTSFLSQWITEKLSKSKNKAVNKLTESTSQAGGAMKIMKFLLPAIMVIFVMTSSSAFGLYIVSSAIISIGISALTSLIVNAVYKKKEEEIVAGLEREAIRSMRKLNKK
ncbi:MAG: membrane protein insertase YidC [Clostridia bacterium]|nr:membrane protein insertase YidC [Clostridia bacterium]